MPGHIGTDIVANSRRYFGGSRKPTPSPSPMSGPCEPRLAQQGIPESELSLEKLRELTKAMEEGFRSRAPLDAAGAATIILAGVRAGKWRILVGDDAHQLDEHVVRADPENAYNYEAGPGLSTLSDLSE